jgi:hypothetical protein
LGRINSMQKKMTIRKEQALKTKQKLIDAAQDLMDEKGYDLMTIMISAKKLVFQPELFIII